MADKKQIAIVGAGISGLLACKHAMEMGFNPTVFESRSRIGGIWAETFASTKLQSPKSHYEFSDFPWPSSVKESFPDHDQVLEYIQSYASHFNLVPRIKFRSKVVSIHYSGTSDEDLGSWDLWGGNGEAFSPTGKWNVIVQDIRNPYSKPEVYRVDFVILCVGKFSDVPNMPKFPAGKGPEVFDGKVIHSMDYAAMTNDRAAQFVKEKRVTVVGFQKSAVDLAAEVARINGVRNPCTMVIKTVHWMIPDYVLLIFFLSLNRFTELMIHKPGEGWFHWFLAFLLSPMIWVYMKLVELYLIWMYPLREYGMVPNHGFLKQISSCSFSILPANFFDRVKEGSLILKKSKTFSFCKNGLIVDAKSTPLETDIVIFATGYNGDEKIKNIFTSDYFQKCIVGSSVPFYRECIHPRIPQLAILGYSASPSVLYSTEMRSKWVAHFLAGKFKLPAIRKMEEEMTEWEKCTRPYAGNYKRSCVSVLLQIFSNDQLCKDMGFNPKRKNWFFTEMFSPYGPRDYKYLSLSQYHSQLHK